MTDGKGQGHQGPAKAQSESLGLIFIFGIVFVSISIVLAAGLPVIDDARENTQIERFQTEFGLLDQEIRESVYAPGESGASISLSDGRVSVDNGSDSMTMTITYDPDASSEITTGEIILGGIEYDAGGDRGVAYEGGGVWAKYRNALSVRDPPDMTYTGTSLNINMMNFTRGLDAGGTTTRNFYFSSGGTHKGAELKKITNSSLGPGELNVSVRSEFSEAWGEYFGRDIADGTGAADVSVTSSPDDRGFANITFETGPPLYSVENALNHTGVPSNDVDIDSSNEVNLTDSRVGDVVLGNYTGTQLDNDEGPPKGIGSLPNAAEVCFRTFEGEDLGSAPSPVNSSTYETSTNNVGAKDYVADGGDIEIYADANQNINNPTTFDTSGGNVEVHVDGGLTLNGDIKINGTGSVYFYVDGIISMQGGSSVEIEDGRTERLQILGTEGANLAGGANYNGTVYAQNSIDIQNNAEMTGAAISADQLNMPGSGPNSPDYTHDASTRGAEPDCAPSPLRNFDAIERRVAVR